MEGREREGRGGLRISLQDEGIFFALCFFFLVKCLEVGDMEEITVCIVLIRVIIIYVQYIQLTTRHVLHLTNLSIKTFRLYIHSNFTVS